MEMRWGLSEARPGAVCCGPGINNIDFSLLKDIKLTERFKLEFRAEFFNIANHAQFTKVDGNISDGDVTQGGTFGKVLARARPPADPVRHEGDLVDFPASQQACYRSLKHESCTNLAIA